LEGIHLPSFRFSWKLKKLSRVDFFCFWIVADRGEIARIKRNSLVPCKIHFITFKVFFSRLNLINMYFWALRKCYALNSTVPSNNRLS
jgi:hypothetical protein